MAIPIGEAISAAAAAAAAMTETSKMNESKWRYRGGEVALDVTYSRQRAGKCYGSG